MRDILFAVGLSACAVSPAFAMPIGLPTDTFVQAWTPLPSGQFTLARPIGRFMALRTHSTEPSGARLMPLLEDAFASGRADTERRDISLSEMMAPWDQPKRTAFQRLRDAEAAYAGADEGRRVRFVATLTRLVDGTGRSAATDRSGTADIDKAYAAALARDPGDARVAREAEQERWRTYADAFAAFADQQTPGSAAGVASELTRQRVSDLDATR